MKDQRKNLQSIDVEELQEDNNQEDNNVEVDIQKNSQKSQKLYDFEKIVSEILYDTPETPKMYNKKN